MTVTFYLPGLAEPDMYDDVDLAQEWPRLKSGRALWIIHTYIRLRNAGHDVRIVGRAPDQGVVVVFARDMGSYLASRGNKSRTLIVCAQADAILAEVSVADVILQHNGLRADDKRVFFVPNWPQAGLVPREPSRGDSLRTISYKGNLEQLHDDFLSMRWKQFLTKRNLSFVLDAPLNDELSNQESPDNSSAFIHGTTDQWHDFSQTDAILAVRPPRRDLYPHKPAVKLVNAWHARTPALLGPERAYREIRRSQFDYVEIASLDDAMRAIDQLRDEPSRFRKMIHNAERRASEYSTENVLGTWEKILFDLLADKQPRIFVRNVRRAIAPVRRALIGVSKRTV